MGLKICDRYECSNIAYVEAITEKGKHEYYVCCEHMNEEPPGKFRHV